MKTGKPNYAIRGDNNPMHNPVTLRKMIKSLYAKPNKTEHALGELLNSLFPNEYRYNDGWLIIGHAVPDFPNVNGKKKLIELFGERWHASTEEKERILHFKQFGEWDTLVVWAKELKPNNIETLMSKLVAFHNA